MKQIIFATTNASKAKRFSKGLKAHDIEVKSLKDLNLSIKTEENGRDAIENALIKARACYKETHMCTIGMDDTLYLEGVPDELQPGLFVRRVNGKTLSDDEMIDHYTDLVKKYGKDGKLNAKWVYGLAVIDENGVEATYTWSKDNIFMVEDPSSTIHPGYPLNSITKYKGVDKYLTDMTEDDLESFKVDESHIVDFICNHIKKKAKNKLDVYRDWFYYLSFFKYNPLILIEADNLWNLLNYIGKNYEGISSKIIIKDEQEYTEISIEDSLNFVQQFLDNHKVDLNLHSLVQEGILIIERDTEKEKNGYYGSISDGHSFYDESGQSRIKVATDGTIYDALVIVHELSHYRNQPFKERSFENDLWTEAVAYANELIFAEELSDDVFLNDKNKLLKMTVKLLYRHVNILYSIYKMIYLYRQKRKLDESSYCELFGDNKYDSMIKEFEFYASQGNSIVRDTWLLLGFPVALYIYQAYKEDKQFFNSLEEFNNMLLNKNEKDVMEYLKTIGINSKKEFTEKIKWSTEKTIQDLEEIICQEHNNTGDKKYN